MTTCGKHLQRLLTRHAPAYRHLVCVVAVALVVLLAGSISLAGVSPADDVSNDNVMRLGERMYREGILPSGKVMEAFIRGDVEVDSTSFSCASCHLRAGLGSVEGGVVTPPTNGAKLFKPYRRPPSFGDVVDKTGRYIYAKTVLERPAYTRESLAKALRFGVDPAGQVFNDVMPRYPLNDRDMGILVRYLERLSSDISPGATPSSFAFATIVTDDVKSEDRAAMLDVLQRFIDGTNSQVEMFRDFLKFGYTPTIDMKYAFRSASLAVWELKGPPESWRKQLEAYYAKGPVFAVLGGISNSSWQPVHDFCEERRLPCLFPITDFPVVSTHDWYTYYFNKGYFQEGEAVANYLNRLESIDDTAPILQIVQDTPTGKALADGFLQSWKDLGRSPVQSLSLSAEQFADPGQLARILAEQPAKVLLLWGDDAILPALNALSQGADTRVPIFASSTALGKKTLQVDEAMRDRVYFSFPYRLTPYLGTREGYDAKVPILTTSKDFGDRRITSRTVTMLLQAALQGLKLLYENQYQDHLLDVMSMQMDQVVRDYERFSFGPGQRYASKGCYIIQLGKGTQPDILPVSEWVIH
ncbi:MAG: ABC transporter substrate-binding protein [Geobacter sp.]|nr:ABC transporter substrate-binding protein [Geobacter sp.]